MQTSFLGKKAEDYAISLLKKTSYKVLDRNFHSRFGEIDIIAIKDGVLIFVEVKARWSAKFGTPEEAVTPGKIQKIVKTAQYYYMTHKNLPEKQRIEVVALEINGGNVTSSKIIQVY